MMKDFDELRAEWGSYGIKIAPENATIAFDSYQVGKFWAAVQDDKVVAYLPVWVDSKADYASYKDKAIACLSAIENTRLELGVIYRDPRGEQYFVARNSRVMKALNRKDRGKPTDLQSPLQILQPFENEALKNRVVLEWGALEMIYLSEAFAVLKNGADDQVGNYATIPPQLSNHLAFLDGIKGCLSVLGEVAQGQLYQTSDGLRYFISEDERMESGLKQLVAVGENSIVEQCLRHQFREVAPHIKLRLFSPEKFGREFLVKKYLEELQQLNIVP